MTASLERRANRLGRAAGATAGSWVEVATAADARLIIEGYIDGDPAVMGMEPGNPLSGEWAGDPLPSDIYASLDMSDDEAAEQDPAGDLLTEYEEGFSAGFWNEVLHTCRDLTR